MFVLCVRQAKKSGFVFGAYSHCKWPVRKDGGRVADPSGQSFLFSLTNTTGQAVRLSLHKKDGAILLNIYGVFFGEDNANFALYVNDKAFDGDRGNVATPPKNCAYQPDDGDLTRGVEFFAGEEYFAAADIEVYEL